MAKNEKTDPALANPIALGPIDDFLKDPDITEIMVNDVRNVMVEKNGEMYFSGFTYPNETELNRMIKSLFARIKKTPTHAEPFVDGILEDGSRVHLIGPPATQGAYCVSIRKYPVRSYSLAELEKFRMFDARIARFLSACAYSRINLAVSGGTSSGKTTLLNALTREISPAERIITIEDTPEIKLDQPNTVRLLSQLAQGTRGAITTRELLAHALRMRPDRILVGECRGAEALDMLQAMNTGHDGSMTTVHANSVRDALSRLETLCWMAGIDMPALSIRKQLASSLQLLVQTTRAHDGIRRVTQLSEITGLEGDTVTLQDLWVWRGGSWIATGFVPTLLQQIRDAGVDLPNSFFAS